jgi:hypothetical protein
MFFTKFCGPAPRRAVERKRVAEGWRGVAARRLRAGHRAEMVGLEGFPRRRIWPARWIERWGKVGEKPRGGRGSGRKRRESADKPGSVAGNHPSGTHVAVRLERPTRKPLRAAGTGPKARALPYLVLLQVGFAVPPSVATGAVRSYRTVSPLPSAALAGAARPDDAGRSRHERLRLGRFAFCCTFRGLAPPRRYLAPCPMEPGLSSTSRDAAIAWPTPARSIGDWGQGIGVSKQAAAS